jgi:hypothetical protein
MSTKTKVFTTKKTDLNQYAAQAILGELNTIAKEREDFEQNEYLRSNQRLYSILGSTYKKFADASSERGVLIETVKMMKAELQAEGGRVQANTTALGLFVRYVFRTDRQRAYNYTNVIKAAIQAGKKPDELAQFIEDAGGVEECKKRTVKSQKTMDKELQIAQAMPLVAEVIANSAQTSLAEFTVPQEFVAETAGAEFTFAICNADASGHVRVISMVPAFSQPMANWAKEKLAVFLAEQQKIAEEKALNSRQEDALASAAKEAQKNNSATETVGELLGA